MSGNEATYGFFDLHSSPMVLLLKSVLWEGAGWGGKEVGWSGCGSAAAGAQLRVCKK